MATLARAISIAASAHEQQQDRSGSPYILHPIRVMMALQTEVEKIVGILHDVVEDTPWTFDDLRHEGFSEEILAALDCVTRRDTETYEEFIERTVNNPIAVRVKIADLEDNMNIRRIEELQRHDVERLHRYHKAWKMLIVIRNA